MLTRALAWIGWLLLGAVALLGVALSALVVLAAVPLGRTAIASAVVRIVDEAIAGSVKLERIEVLAGGVIQLRGLSVLDPDGHLVLAVERARVSVDATALPSRTVALELELDAPSVILEEQARGGTSLARAFAPSRQGPRPGTEQKARGPAKAGGRGGSGWTVHLSRVEIRSGKVRWADALGRTRLEAGDLEVEARGTWSSRRARAEVRLRGEVSEPFASPIALDLVGSRAGDVIRVPLMKLEAGGTALSALGDGDLARRRGRLVMTYIAISRHQARALMPSVPDGEDVRGSGYAESDGRTITAALNLEPRDGSARGGRADASVAMPLQATRRRAVGFDIALDHLDPARLSTQAPPGEVTLTARGAAAGTSLGDARGRVALSVSRSRLRRGEVSRAEVELRAAQGTLQVDRLSAASPGVAMVAAGSWRRSGAVSASASVDAPDLAVASRNLALLLGKRVPALAGRARAVAELSGTSSAPSVSATLDAPSLRASNFAADGVHLALSGAGPWRVGEGRAEGAIAEVRNAAGRWFARQVTLRAAIHGGEGTLSATASLPGTHGERFTIDGRGRLGARRESLLVGQLAVAWPGARWSLVRPAVVDLRRPSVDHVELAAGSQRIAVSGGLGARGALNARAEISQLDLARLPPIALSAVGPMRGELSASLTASGSTRRPVVHAKMALADGAWRDLAGIDALGEAWFEGVGRRARASLSVTRAAGGTLDLSLDVPIPLARRPAEPLKAEVHATALPVPELLALAGRKGVAAGALTIDARVGGTAGAPAFSGEVSLADGAWRDLEAISATITMDDPGSTFHVTASGSIGGRHVLALDGQARFELSGLVMRPEETLRRLSNAPIRARADITSLDLAELAGRAGLPTKIAGLVDAHADLAGPAAAPRGMVSVDVDGAMWKGWRRVGGHVELSAGEQGITASGKLTSTGEEALRFTGSLGIPAERLTRRDALLKAPFRIEATVPRVEIAPMSGEALPISGTLEGRLSASGTPQVPRLSAELAGTGISIEGHPLGDARASVHYADQRGDGEVALRSSSGGTLQAHFAVSAGLGLGASRAAILDAPTEIVATSDGVDLAFLAAIAPGVIRSAAGRLALDVRAKGPLRRLSPRGTLRVTDGRLAVAELGEWTGVAIDARVSDEDLEVSRFEVHRGKGRLSASGSLRGLRSDTSRLSAQLRAESFTVARAGMDLATIDVAADASGTWARDDLEVEVKIPHGVVRLPKKSPRTLQSLEERKDIVVGQPLAKQKEAKAGPAPQRAGATPFTLHAHVVVPRDLFVKSDNPRMDVELKADVRYELSGRQDYAEGSIEVVRGNVEPIAGRDFTINRGRAQFTGGPPRAALLDIEAKYENPAATVTVTVSGPLSKPNTQLSSKPPMEDAQIAMLLVTGRTDLKAGSGGVGSITGEEAGRAALGVVATQAFRNLVRDKLPLDVVALDSGQLRAGKYVTGKFYVGYVRRFEADPTKNENEDEVRVEYQIKPGWMLESRYGNAGSGGASLMWTKDY